MDIAGSVVVVTGGGSGIGAALARSFAEAGADTVVVSDIDVDQADIVAREVGGVAVALDVTDPEATKTAMADVENRFGRIDILCLNAGIATAGDVFTDDATWRRTFDVNVMAHLYGLRSVLPGMIDRGRGHIVVTASAAGLLTNLGAAPYAVSKHAAVSLAEWVAISYGDRGIGVCCVCPQFVETPMLDVFSDHSPQMRSWVSDIAIDADVVAQATIDAVGDGTFLVLPHPEVADYVELKAQRPDRWLEAMRSLQRELDAAPDRSGVTPP